jgi:DNA-binding transcriptional MerR regulator
MTENQDLINHLKRLIGQKKSKQFYAKKLGVSVEDVEEALQKIRNASGGLSADELFAVLKVEEDLNKREAEITAEVKEQIRTLDELIEKCKIDTKIWNIDRYIQNTWGNPKDPSWQVKVWLSKKVAGENFQKFFIDFLKEYRPTIYQQPSPILNPKSPRGCLVINKQDQHLNKYDILGSNSIGKRFDSIYKKTQVILDQASHSNKLEKVYYIVGSDQFNAEWSGTTTKGTKQENLTTYHQTFESICNHEINMINLLLKYSNDVEILFVSGNHDEYVGWHLINWLKAYYRGGSDVKFDTSARYRKYVRYGRNALMFNHGDAIKPPKLANMFPVEFKDEWSNCDNYYIFTGDKHHEITMDFHGIMFFQLPALSKAKSFWDDKQGHTCSKAELVAFLIDETDGVTGILKQKV